VNEFYAVKPVEVELFPHGDGVDLILRKNIRQCVDEEGSTHWECQEAQSRYEGALSEEDVEQQFERWWRIATAGTDELAKAKEKKLAELSAVCNATIVKGVDVQLEDGMHHFGMAAEDQMNLLALLPNALAGQAVPYHGDGEPCRFFTAEEFTLIADTATKQKLWHESYYNSMRVYINALEDLEQINGIVYGDSIPDEYQTDVFKSLSQEQT
jgi:hypothetical protein